MQKLQELSKDASDMLLKAEISAEKAKIMTEELNQDYFGIDENGKM